MLVLCFAWIQIICSLLVAPAAASVPVALIYNGKGSCPKACAIAVAIAAKEAGLSPHFVGDREIHPNFSPLKVHALFQNAKVWIQPGGFAKDAYEAMSANLKEEILNFVAGGGGYVGFCAGGFMATDHIGTTGHPGLGLVPGRSATFLATPAREGLNFSIEKVRWMSAEQQLYFEGGPFFYDLGPEVEVVATYADEKTPAAVRTQYGRGRVFVSGPHPEAPAWWWKKDGVEVEDEEGLFLAVEMIRWAAGLDRGLLFAELNLPFANLL